MCGELGGESFFFFMMFLCLLIKILWGFWGKGIKLYCFSIYFVSFLKLLEEFVLFCLI